MVGPPAPPAPPLAAPPPLPGPPPLLAAPCPPPPAEPLPSPPLPDERNRVGSSLQAHRHDAASNPMTRTEVDEKCYRLMAPILGSKRARTLCDTVWAIEGIDDARQLRPLLQA